MGQQAEHPETEQRAGEWGSVKLALRGDLTFTPQMMRGESYYVIEDEINSKFHRVGIVEYAFISLLDGRTTVGEALSMAAAAAPQHALSEHEAAAICTWLIDSDLASISQSSRASSVARPVPQQDKRVSWRRFNPLVLRLPLFHPDRLFQRLLPWLGWMHSPIALAIWLALALAAVYHVAARWEQFLLSSDGILAPGNWLWLLTGYVALKFIHELSHGIVCKKYGGFVREAGVILILFAPLPYVDVTSSWRFRSKWPRIQTAAAGIYIEMLIAAVSSLIWCATEPGLVNHVCHNLVIMASLMTLVINANPLMRFDGYYIASDLLEIPNLYAAGQQYVRYWMRRHLLGVSAQAPSWSRSRRILVPFYGLASMFWRILICASLIVGASRLFHGAGIVLAVLAALLWVGMPAAGFAKYLLWGRPGEKPNLLRFAAIAGTAATLCTALVVAVPWPAGRQAPAIVEYEPLTVIRAGSAGFVKDLRADSGQYVKKGDVLAVLTNDQLQFELADLVSEIKQSEVHCRIFNQAQKTAAYQAEMQYLDSLKRKLQEKQAQVGQLTVRATTSGKIMGRALSWLEGTYVEEGATIAFLGNEGQKELRLSVSQEDLDAFHALLDRPVKVQLSHRSPFRSMLVKMEPRAQLTPPHPALSASMGGPLAVRRSGWNADQSPGQRAAYELLAPRFTGIVRLSEAQSLALHAGQLATVTARSYDRSIGSHLYQLISRWIERRIRPRAKSDE